MSEAYRVPAAMGSVVLQPVRRWTYARALWEIEKHGVAPALVLEWMMREPAAVDAAALAYVQGKLK